MTEYLEHNTYDHLLYVPWAFQLKEALGDIVKKEKKLTSF